MPNVPTITADELADAPELPLGLPPIAPGSTLPRNLPLPVQGPDLAAATECAAILDGLDPLHAARLIRWLVARYQLVDLW